ncbi:hypothetical protein V2G26_003444 [Clonostachys chloroleuca]
MSENAMAPNYDIQRMFLFLRSGRHSQCSSIVGFGHGSAPVAAPLGLHTQVRQRKKNERKTSQLKAVPLAGRAWIMAYHSAQHALFSETSHPSPLEAPERQWL